METERRGDRTPSDRTPSDRTPSETECQVRLNAKQTECQGDMNAKYTYIMLWIMFWHSMTIEIKSVSCILVILIFYLLKTILTQETPDRLIKIHISFTTYSRLVS